MQTIRLKTLLSTMSLLCILITLVAVPAPQANAVTYGPRLDTLYGLFVEAPAVQEALLRSGHVDIWFDIIDQTIATRLETLNYQVTYLEETYQFYYIAFNMRDQVGNGTHIPCSGGTYAPIWRNADEPDYFTYQGAAYKGYVPLNDTAFRHASAHCIPKDAIAASYGGSAHAINSVVPEAQRAWHDPAVIGHPYNPGDPVTSTAGDGTACGILKEAGYVWSPTAPNPAPKHSITDPNGNWIDPHTGEPMNHITFAGVMGAFSPTSWTKDDMCVGELRAIGLPIQHVLVSYGYLTNTMMNHYQFDMYALGWEVGRWPDHLYGFFHSSNNFYPGGYNIPGIEDPGLDYSLETVQFSVQLSEVKAACFDAQEMVAEKLPYIVTVTRSAICASAVNGAGAHNDTLKGIVNSPGFGQENDYTFCSLHWESMETPQNPYGIGESAKMIVGSKPTNYHPGYASTTDEWMAVGRLFDGLINIDAYTHYEIPWLATDWTVEDWDYGGSEMGMETTFYLRDDVYYHDGTHFDAYTCEFSLEFARDQQIARAKPMWQNLVDVEVHDEYCFSVYHNVTSWWIFHYVAGPTIWLVDDAACWATMFPPHIYSGTDIHFRPEATPNPLNGNLSCLVGTGPFMLTDLDFSLGGYVELTAYRENSDLGVTTHWWMSVEGYGSLVAEQFHWIGDVNSDGIVDIYDLTRMGSAFATTEGHPNYDPEADIAPEPIYHTNDDRVDIRDIAELSKNWGKQRDYP